MKYLKPYYEASKGLAIIEDCRDILLDLSDLHYDIHINYLREHTDEYADTITFRPDLLVKFMITKGCKNLSRNEHIKLITESDEVLRLISYLGSCGYNYYTIRNNISGCSIQFHTVNKYYHVVSEKNPTNFLLKNVRKGYATEKVFKTNLTNQQFFSLVMAISDKDWYEQNAIKIYQSPSS